MTLTEAIKKKAADIKLLALDVDGVLTNGDILVLPDGQEIKRFNAKDGHGIRRLLSLGIPVALITGRGSAANDHRAKDLGITLVFQKVKDKCAVLQSITEQYGITLSQVAYMGDDMPDAPVLKQVGLPCCPADAVEEVKSLCDFVSSRKGGQGAVRELADIIYTAINSVQAK